MLTNGFQEEFAETYRRTLQTFQSQLSWVKSRSHRHERARPGRVVAGGGARHHWEPKVSFRKEVRANFSQSPRKHLRLVVTAQIGMNDI